MVINKMIKMITMDLVMVLVQTDIVVTAHVPACLMAPYGQAGIGLSQFKQLK
jgi:hypothetical protein